MNINLKLETGLFVLVKGDGTRVINTESFSLKSIRALLTDRIGNNEAFNGEHVEKLMASVYDYAALGEGPSVYWTTERLEGDETDDNDAAEEHALTSIPSTEDLDDQERRWNCHDELVRVLEGYTKVFRACHGVTPIDDERGELRGFDRQEFANLEVQARAILAKCGQKGK